MVTNTGEITSTRQWDVCVCFVPGCEPFSVETICRITFNRSNQFLAVVFAFVASLNFAQFVTTTGNKCVVGGHETPLSIQTKRQQQFLVSSRESSHHETNQFPVERFNQRQLEFRCEGGTARQMAGTAALLPARTNRFEF